MSHILSTGALMTGSDFAIRQPKPVRWEPHADITTHELALAMNALLLVAGGNRGFDLYLEDHIAALPENVRRHFQIG